MLIKDTSPDVLCNFSPIVIAGSEFPKHIRIHGFEKCTSIRFEISRQTTQLTIEPVNAITIYFVMDNIFYCQLLYRSNLKHARRYQHHVLSSILKVP